MRRFFMLMFGRWLWIAGTSNGFVCGVYKTFKEACDYARLDSSSQAYENALIFVNPYPGILFRNGNRITESIRPEMIEYDDPVSHERTLTPTWDVKALMKNTLITREQVTKNDSLIANVQKIIDSHFTGTMKEGSNEV